MCQLGRSIAGRSTADEQLADGACVSFLFFHFLLNSFDRTDIFDGRFCG